HGDAADRSAAGRAGRRRAGRYGVLTARRRPVLGRRAPARGRVRGPRLHGPRAGRCDEPRRRPQRGALRTAGPAASWGTMRPCPGSAVINSAAATTENTRRDMVAIRALRLCMVVGRGLTPPAPWAGPGDGVRGDS